MSLFSDHSRSSAAAAASRLLRGLEVDRSVPLVLVNWAAATSNVYGGDPKVTTWHPLSHPLSRPPQALTHAVARVIARWLFLQPLFHFP
jgi:hypothetical protein